MTAADGPRPAAVPPRKVGAVYWLGLWAVDAVSIVVFAARAVLGRTRGDIRILCYHDIADVSPADDPYRVAVPVAIFEAQMRYLHRRGYRFLSCEQAAELLGGADVPERAVVITFDDGYESVLRTALPILTRFGIPATLFAPVQHIGTPRFPWNPLMTPLTRPLNWEGLETLIRATRLEVGSHTMTHSPLHTLPPAQQEEELRASRDLLRARLGRPVRVFAYPFGGWPTFPADVQARVQASGYVAACVNVMGANTRGANRFALRRVRIGWEDTLWRFRLKLAGAYDWSDAMRRILASLRARARAVAA